MELMREIGVDGELFEAMPPSEQWRKFIYCTSLLGEDIASIEALVAAAQQQTALVCRLCDRFGLGLRVFELAPELPVRDFTNDAAMEEADCAATIAYGMEATAGGADLLAVRTAAAGHGAAVAAMAACLLGPREDGPLTTLARSALGRHSGHADAPLEVLRRMGGRETAAAAGAIIAARMQQVPVILDGSGALCAAMLLKRLRPGAADHVRADAAGGQLRQVGQRVQFPDDDLGGTPGRRAGPGSDTGGRGETVHRAKPTRRRIALRYGRSWRCR
jgi:nicotinate-nucleotide--dimethylbenzimidazole phosphoribosyltransferase